MQSYDSPEQVDPQVVTERKSPDEDVEIREWIRNAARASWLAPLIAFGVKVVTREVLREFPVGGLVVGIFELLLILMGLICGIVAISSATPSERRRIRWPSTVGIFVNLALIGLVVLAWFALQNIRAQHL